MIEALNWAGPVRPSQGRGMGNGRHGRGQGRDRPLTTAHELAVKGRDMAGRAGRATSWPLTCYLNQ